MKSLIPLCILMSLIGCGASPKKINNCNFNAINAAEFVLREMDAQSRSNAYEFNNVPSKGWETKLNYKKTVNIHGKIYTMPPKEDFPSWAKITQGEYTPIIFEDCNVLYTRNWPIHKDNKFVENYVNGAYFVDDLNKAKSYIGKNIWKKLDTSSNTLIKLATNKNDETYDILPYEELEVIGIDTKIYKHITGYAPFHLKVKDKKGNEGIVKYTSKAIHKENPFNKGWSKKNIQSIKKGIVLVGMSKSQTVLAWGLPDKVNKTTSSKSSREQWVYGRKNYLYFHNGFLSTIQN